jgi:hypothetical protein
MAEMVDSTKIILTLTTNPHHDGNMMEKINHFSFSS